MTTVDLPSPCGPDTDPNGKMAKAQFHPFRSCSGKFFCLDVNSTAICEIDAIHWDVLRTCGGVIRLPVETMLEAKYPRDDIARAISELLMQQTGELETATETTSLDRANSSMELERLSLTVTSACNLSCVYCYHRSGEELPKVGQHMSLDVARKSVELLLANSVGEVCCSFVGGEPLLRLDFLEKVIDYCEQSNRPFRYAITTNGTLLDSDAVEFLRRWRFKVLVSYDGYQQDRLRPDKRGRGIRDVVRKNVARMSAVLPRGNAKLHATLVRGDFDFAAVVADAAELGLPIELAAGTLAEETGLRLSRQDILDLYGQKNTELAIATKEPKRMKALSIAGQIGANVITQIRAGRKHRQSCGLGRTLLAVGPQGDIFPCHRFVGDNRTCLGNVASGIDTNAWSRVSQRNVDERSCCAVCWARYFCGGGCAHHAYCETGGFLEADQRICDWIRNDVEYALQVYVTVLERYPNMIAELYGPATSPTI